MKLSYIQITVKQSILPDNQKKNKKLCLIVFSRKIIDLRKNIVNMIFNELILFYNEDSAHLRDNSYIFVIKIE